VQTWFALVPIGCRAPELDIRAMEKKFESNLRQIVARIQSDNKKQFESAVMDSPQPNMVLLLISALMQSAEEAPREFRASVEAQPVILALLKTIIEELDTALRPE
jgi:hypothetical protein